MFHTSLDAAQDMVCLLGFECTLLGHVELLINQHHQVLLLRAALSLFSSQPVSVLGIFLTQVQDRALGLVELHELLTLQKIFSQEDPTGVTQIEFRSLLKVFVADCVSPLLC